MNQSVTLKYLLEPVFRDGIRNTHFFNGRLLTAEALRDEQQANRQQHEQLGLALGDGVVHGFEVSVASAAETEDASTRVRVRVTRGLALNRAGQALELAQDLDVALARERPAVPPEAGLFAECSPASSSLVGPATGIYILAVTPASGFRERAPRHSLDTQRDVAGCGSRYTVEGVKFRLVELNPNRIGNISAATRDEILRLMGSKLKAERSMLRNLLAHLCFGTEQLLEETTGLLTAQGVISAPSRYGVVDALRTDEALNDCDVPLAIFFWDSGGIQFLDMWSVRRQPTPPRTADGWPFSDDRRLAEAEASFLQFQDHVAGLVRSDLNPAELAVLHAEDYFRFLPAAGLLPVAEFSNRGFNPDFFFAAQPHRSKEFMDGLKIRSLISASLAYEPIDLDNNPGQMVWLYRVWQNEHSIGRGEPTPPYMVFSTPHLPPQGVARFDVARWDYSNYARGCEP